MREVEREYDLPGLGSLIHYKQETTGNWMFSGAHPVCTRGIVSAFGKETAALLMRSIVRIIDEAYDEPDYLQVFRFRNRVVYCIADFRKGDSVSDYQDIPFLYVTLLFPEEV